MNIKPYLYLGLLSVIAACASVTSQPTHKESGEYEIDRVPLAKGIGETVNSIDDMNMEALKICGGTDGGGYEKKKVIVLPSKITWIIKCSDPNQPHKE